MTPSAAKAVRNMAALQRGCWLYAVFHWLQLNTRWSKSVSLPAVERLHQREGQNTNPRFHNGLSILGEAQYDWKTSVFRCCFKNPYAFFFFNYRGSSRTLQKLLFSFLPLMILWHADRFRCICPVLSDRHSIWQIVPKKKNQCPNISIVLECLSVAIIDLKRHKWDRMLWTDILMKILYMWGLLKGLLVQRSQT